MCCSFALGPKLSLPPLAAKLPVFVALSPVLVKQSSPSRAKGLAVGLGVRIVSGNKFLNSCWYYPKLWQFVKKLLFIISLIDFWNPEMAVGHFCLVFFLLSCSVERIH